MIVVPSFNMAISSGANSLVILIESIGIRKRIKIIAIRSNCGAARSVKLARHISPYFR